MNDFDNAWEICIRQLGASAQDPKAVAKWFFDRSQREMAKHKARQSVICIDGRPHAWRINSGDIAECSVCGSTIDI